MKGLISLLLSLFGNSHVTSVKTEFCKINPFVGHIQVLKELKAGIEEKKCKSTINATNNTPTLAYLKAAKSILNSQELAELDARKQQYPKFVEQVIEKEKQFCNDYYVFYHSQQVPLSIFQDFLKELYALINIHNPIEEFSFLRMWHEAEQAINANEFLKKLDKENAWWGTYAKSLMCVNLSLFGNLNNLGEDSFWYFKNGHNCAPPKIQNLLEELCKHFGLDKKYVSKITDLSKIIDTQEGHLLQIFIPKEKANDYFYLSFPGCTPYSHKIDDATYDNAKKRHTKISPILDKYIGDLSSINQSNLLQARLLLSNDFMLNPSSGVKIFKHTTVPEAQMQNYKSKIKLLAQEVFSDAIEKKTFKNIQDTRLNKLLSLMKNK